MPVAVTALVCLLGLSSVNYVLRDETVDTFQEWTLSSSDDYSEPQPGWINAQSYGAVGDGRVDDSPALARALTAAVGKTLWIPRGIYLVGAALQIRSRTVVVFAGSAILKAKHNRYGDAILKIHGASDVTVRGGTLDGDKARNPLGRLFGLVVENSSSVLIEGLTSRNMPGSSPEGDNGGDGILLGGSKGPAVDVFIDKCFLENNVRQGISITWAQRVTVTNCMIRGTSGTNPGAGVDIEPDPGQEATDITIAHNTLENNNYGIVAALYTAKRISIRQNVLRSHRDVSVRSSGYDVRIERNTVELRRASGIFVYGSPRAVVNENSITASGNASNHGIVLADSAGAVLTGNVVTSTSGHALLVDEATYGTDNTVVRGIRISGNEFENCGAASLSDEGVILLRDSAARGRFLANVTLENNAIRDFRPRPQNMDVGIDAREVNRPSAASFVVRGNSIRGVDRSYAGVYQT